MASAATALFDTTAVAATDQQHETTAAAIEDEDRNDELSSSLHTLRTVSNDRSWSWFGGCGCGWAGAAGSSMLRNARSHWKVIVLGQALSFLLACTGAAQATLSFDCHLSAPTFTVGCFYFALAFCLVPVHLQHRRATTTTVRGRQQQQQQQQQELISVAGNGNEEGLNASAATGRVPRPKENRQGSSAAYRSSSQETTRQQGGDAPASDGEIIITQSGTGDAVLVVGTTATLPAPPPPPYSILFGLVPLQGPPYVYLIIAVIDVYGNYFTVLAFKYTTITSVTLFDALAIPTSMVLSIVFLKRQFTALHLVGVLACSIGIVLNVLQDYEDDKRDDSGGGGGNNNNGDDVAAHKLRGDVYALCGGILFGVNNVAVEVAVRKLGGVCEYLGMLGLFATIICAIQASILERAEIAEFFSSPTAGGEKEATCRESMLWYLLAAYFVSSVLSYLGGALFLQISEATFFNLSLLSGDLWSVLFSVFAERVVPHPLFFVALAFILSGVVVYEMAPTPVLEDREREQEEQQQGNRRHHGYDLALQRTSTSSRDEVDRLELQQTRRSTISTGNRAEEPTFC